MKFRFCAAILIVATTPLLPAAPAHERTAPPPGLRIADADRARLELFVTTLGQDLDALRARAKSDARVGELLPDVEVFYKAVDWALRYDEFFRSNEVALADNLLRLGTARAKQLAEGKPAWLTSTGLVVRGYRSKIDGSVQPYGLVVPSSFASNTNRSRRLDVWLHGRDDKLTELKFISDRLRSYGEFTPTDTLVLHPYGRFCNAFKFAGETDVFEALAHAQKYYPVDTNRLGLRGFSMGGAGVWHLAAHHPGVWAAAAPGAGFAETADYTGALKKEPKPPWYEQKLWRLYDATAYAANFHNLPVIAYSGELDKQKQAADVMARAMKAEGLELQHIIGPGVAHKYEPGAKNELARRFDALMEKGREPWPKHVRFSTFSTRYNQAAWVSVIHLICRWERATVDAEWVEPRTLRIVTTNLDTFYVDIPPSIPATDKVRIVIDGDSFVTQARRGAGDGSLRHIFGRAHWHTPSPVTPQPVWQYFMQTPMYAARPGPIDDAFVDSFVAVRPTKKPMSARLGEWVDAEFSRFTNEWRAQFRGDVQVTDGREDEFIRAANSGSHLVLWGDPASNPLIAKVLTIYALQLQWNARELRLGTNRFDAVTHVPVLFFANPYNPSRYIVLNSGPTFFDFGAASNAQQTPKLPDYAVIDITVPRAERLTRGVVLAGFFDEQWQLPAGPGALSR